MKHFKITVIRTVRDFWRDRRGGTFVLFAGMIPAVLGVAGLDGRCRPRHGRQAGVWPQGTQAAALAGAYALASPGATSSTVSTAITNWNTANPISHLTVTTGDADARARVTTTSRPAELQCFQSPRRLRH